MAESTASRDARIAEIAEQSLKLAQTAARVAADNRGQNILLLDMRKLTALVDYFLLATGTSRRQLHAMSEEIDRVLQEELGEHRLRLEGYRESRWIVLDYGSLMVHLFDQETRDFYDLENLWAEADRVDLSQVLADTPTL